MPQLLRPEAVENLLGEVPNWKLRENSIERTFKFSGFQEAIDFVNRVAQEAENMNHHPDIDIRWNKVKLVLSTHSAGGLTNNDFMLATKVDSSPSPESFRGCQMVEARSFRIGPQLGGYKPNSVDPAFAEPRRSFISLGNFV